MESRVSIYSREFSAAVDRADKAEFTLAEVRRLAQIVPPSTAMQTTEEERKYWSYDPEVRTLTIENVTSRSFDADWYGGHASWRIVEVSLELL